MVGRGSFTFAYPTAGFPMPTLALEIRSLRWQQVAQVFATIGEALQARKTAVLVFDAQNIVIARFPQRADDSAPVELAAAWDPVLPPPVADDALAV